MLTPCLLSFCILWASVSFAEHERKKVIGYRVYQQADYTERINKEKLLEAFIHVESKGNENAVNKNSGAVGCLQIMPILIKEANRILGEEKYKLSDRTNKRKSKEIFHVIMEHKNPEYDIEKSCAVWNPNGKPSYTDSIKKKYYELISR